MPASSFTLLPWQSSLFGKFKEVFAHPDLQNIVVLARRQICHKSASALACMLYALTHSQDATYLWFSPVYKMAGRQFKELMKWNRQYNLHCHLDFNKSQMLVTCTDTNSTLQFNSLSEPDNVRGETADGIVIDEAAFIDDDALSIVNPMIDVNRAWMLWLSTPWRRSGMFYNLFNDPSSIVEDWTQYDLSEIVTQERLEFYKRTLSPTLYKTDILGQWLDDGESLLYGDITNCIVEDVDYRNEPLYVGVDCSAGTNDYNAITAFFMRDGIAYELFCEHFRNNETRDNIQRFYDILTKYANQIKVVNWESNSIGKPMMDNLKDRLRQGGFYNLCSKIREDYWSSSTKGSAIADSVLWFRTDSIRLHTEYLIKECCNYTEIINERTGAVSFGNARQGDRDVHDDAWASALHALAAVRKGTKTGYYSIG